MFRRRVLSNLAPEPIYALTKADNAKMFDVMRSKGYCADTDVMTIEEAEAVRTFITYGTTTIFSSIEYPFFLDMRYFINVAALSNSYIQGLFKFCFPAKRIESNPFFKLGPNVKVVIIPKGCVIAVDYVLNGKNISPIPTFTLIVEDEDPSIPFTGTRMLTWECTVSDVYVPDDSVMLYKASSKWSTYRSKIKPISDYVEPTP